MKKAVVLLSGGLDSATLLYFAKEQGFAPHCLIFDYGQRHRKEITLAKRVARAAGCTSSVVKITLPCPPAGRPGPGGTRSSLLDKSMKLPRHAAVDPERIPSTYVPGRNIIFLSFAASCAEAMGARAIFIGANAIDYSGYPDCRPEFFRPYQRALKAGLKTGVNGRAVKIRVPFMRKTKAQIIRAGLRLKVPYALTWSCYAGGKRPCGTCDSCVLRAKGFKEAGAKDPVLHGRNGARSQGRKLARRQDRKVSKSQGHTGARPRGHKVAGWPAGRRLSGGGRELEAESGKLRYECQDFGNFQVHPG